MGESYTAILVYSTSHAIRIEKMLKEQKVVGKLIPVPRQLSSDCGVCIRIARNERETARAVILASRIEIQDIIDF
jgi:hypothetical protein